MLKRLLFYTLILSVVGVAGYFQYMEEMNELADIRSKYKNTSFYDDEEVEETDYSVAEVKDGKGIEIKEEKKAEEKVVQAKKKIAKVKKALFSDELKNMPGFREITDHGISLFDVIDQEGNEKLNHAAAEKINDRLLECLSDKSCIPGPMEGSALYSETSGPRHDMMSRAMHIIILLQEENEDLKYSMNEEKLDQFVSLGNEKIQTLALELYMDQDLEVAQIDRLMEKSRTFSGEAQASLMTRLGNLSNDSTALRSKYLDVLYRNVSNKDGRTAVEIMKKMSFMNLNENEFAGLGKQLCKHNSPQNQHNFKAINKLYQMYQDSRGFKNDLSNLCQSI